MKLDAVIRKTSIGVSQAMEDRLTAVGEMLSTPFCEATAQIVIQSLLERMSAEQIAEHVRPVVVALDVERGARFKVTQQIGQLRHRLRKLGENDPGRAELVERLRKLEAERDDA